MKDGCKQEGYHCGSEKEDEQEGEMEQSVRLFPFVHHDHDYDGKWEERNNENKKDVLKFGTEEGNECRVCWGTGLERMRMQRAELKELWISDG